MALTHFILEYIKNFCVFVCFFVFLCVFVFLCFCVFFCVFCVFCVLYSLGIHNGGSTVRDHGSRVLVGANRSPNPRFVVDVHINYLRNLYRPVGLNGACSRPAGRSLSDRCLVKQAASNGAIAVHPRIRGCIWSLQGRRRSRGCIWSLFFKYVVCDNKEEAIPLVVAGATAVVASSGGLDGCHGDIHQAAEELPANFACSLVVSIVAVAERANTGLGVGEDLLGAGHC